MSFIRIFAPAFFFSVIASQAIAAGNQIEGDQIVIAQSGNFGNTEELIQATDAGKATDACKGKTLGAACSYHSSYGEQNGTCKQLPPRQLPYGGTMPQPVSCQ